MLSILAAILAFAPPAPPTPRICELWIDVPEQLVLSEIEGVLLRDFPEEYELRIRRWPTQYGTASPPAERWYRVDRGERGWELTFRDLDDGELVTLAIAAVGHTIEDDIGSELTTHAIAACHHATVFTHDMEVLAAASEPPPPAPTPSPLPLPPPPRGRDGTGLLATSLSFGLAGLALGVGGFAYAYDQKELAAKLEDRCERYGDPAQGCDWQNDLDNHVKRSMVGTGIGSTGATLCGVGLLLAIPTAILMRRVPTQRWAARPRISGSLSRHGGGVSIAISF